MSSRMRYTWGALLTGVQTCALAICVGCIRRYNESFVLGIEHMKGMPTRTSANQAIVDALKGPNNTTIQEIRNELRAINRNLALLVEQRSEEHTSELQSLMRISYAVFCLKKKNN